MPIIVPSPQGFGGGYGGYGGGYSSYGGAYGSYGAGYGGNYSYRPYGAAGPMYGGNLDSPFLQQAEVRGVGLVVLLIFVCVSLF